MLRDNVSSQHLYQRSSNVDFSSTQIRFLQLLFSFHSCEVRVYRTDKEKKPTHNIFVGKKDETGCGNVFSSFKCHWLRLQPVASKRLRFRLFGWLRSRKMTSRLDIIVTKKKTTVSFKKLTFRLKFTVQHTRSKIICDLKIVNLPYQLPTLEIKILVRKYPSFISYTGINFKF